MRRLPLGRVMSVITVASALLALTPAAADAEGRGFKAFGGGVHGLGHGGGRLEVGFGHGARSFGARRNFIVASRYDNKRRRPDGITLHRAFGRSKLLHGSRFKNYYRRGFFGTGAVFYDGFSGRGTRVENTIVVPPAQDQPAPQAAPARPFEPKIIEIASLPRNEDGSIALAPQAGELSEKADNCLTVRREIIVDGQTMEAFGKACMDADGSWHLSPDG